MSCLLLHFLFHLPFHLLLVFFSFVFSSLSLSVSLSASLCLCLSLSVSPCGVVVVLLSCVVLCCSCRCGVVWVSVITFSCLGDGFPSHFVHFSFVASLSFRVWPAEVHSITGAGRQSPYSRPNSSSESETLHSEVSAWTSRTTLRWCPSVSRFMFQACDHAPPRTRNFNFSTAPVVLWVETIPKCQGLVFATRLQVHSVPPESNFPVYLKSHPDTVEMTARCDGAYR